MFGDWEPPKFVEEFEVTGSVNGKITSPRVIFGMTSELVWKWYNPETAQVAEMNTCGCQGNSGSRGHTIIWPCGTSGEDGYIEQDHGHNGGHRPSEYYGHHNKVFAVVGEIKHANAVRRKLYHRMKHKQANDMSMLGPGGYDLKHLSDSCPKCDERFPFKELQGLGRFD